MGEVANHDPILKRDSVYLANQGTHLRSLQNYPMYYAISDVFGEGKPMSVISDLFEEQAQVFGSKRDYLALFADNHDVPRFLHQNGDKALFKSVLTFVLTAPGIPVVYYGSEQELKGDN